MDTQEKWPNYEVADEAVVYALGIMNINYVRFERAHVWMLAATANVTEEQAAVFVSRINPNERAQLIDNFFKRRDWPDPCSDAIRHYIGSMRTLTESRNTLIHGNIVTSFGSEPGIFSLNRSGFMTMFRSSLADVRQVADDLEVYFQFGLSLANYIAVEVHEMAQQAGMIVVQECPDLPPSPRPIRPRAAM